MSHLPRRDAPRRLHHAMVSDRPDPRAPPHPRRDPRRRAESALDPRTVWTGPHATTRRGPPGPLSLTPTPRSRAGTFGVRVRPTGASDPSPRRPGADGNRRPGGHRGAAAGGDQAAARRPALAGYAIAPCVHWILDRARLNFLSCDTRRHARTTRSAAPGADACSCDRVRRSYPTCNACTIH